MKLAWIVVVSGGCNSLLDIHDFAPPQPTADGGHDAAFDTDITVDAAQTVFIIEAEAFTSNTSMSSTSWVLSNTFLGFSGAGYMRGNPMGSVCTTSTNCAVMRYPVALSVPGDYYLHLRMSADINSADSAFAGVDGGGSPLLFDAGEDSIWRWLAGQTPLTLAAGAHTIDVYMREGDSRVDMVAISMSSTADP